jgi:hypothetical protein
MKDDIIVVYFLEQFKQLGDRKQLLIDFLCNKCDFACFVKEFFIIEVL